MKTKRCSVYVRNADEGPSCYYRVIQYTKDIDVKFQVNNLMTKNMFRLNLNWKHRHTKILIQTILYIVMMFRGIFFLLRDLIRPPQYIIIQRTTMPRYISKFMQVLLKQTLSKAVMYWDFDDDIFVSGEICKKQAEILSRYSCKIIVTSEHLKNKIQKEYRDKVIILPTTDGDFKDDYLDAGYMKKKKDYTHSLKLIWVGTSSNLNYIERIISDLEKAAKILFENQKKELVLLIVSNKSISHSTKYLKIHNIRWTRDVAIKEICHAHVGLMPLAYSEYALGKGGFKLVQYICAGLPVIASKVGFNTKVVNNENGFLIGEEDSDGWIQAILELSEGWEKWEKYSENAKTSWKLNFSYNNNLKVWRDLFSEEVQ